MTDSDILESGEMYAASVISELVPGLHLHKGTMSLNASPFGAGLALRAATAGSSSEMAPRRRAETGRHSTIWIYLGQHGRAQLRHRGRMLTPHRGDVLLIDSDAGFSLESAAPHAHAVLLLPQAILGPRLRLLRARAGDLFERDDPKTSVVREGLLSLMNAGPILSADEQASAFSAALHLIDILVTPADAGSDKRLLARAMAAVDRRIADPGLNPASLARELGVSRRLMENAFAANRLTVSRCIWNLRLTRAAEGIAADRAARKTLLQIAAGCGFVSAAHFTRAFSAKFGTTPSQYRNARR
jgi:AraC family transcriptional regulator, positive regulator of tynA and feaB